VEKEKPREEKESSEVPARCKKEKKKERKFGRRGDQVMQKRRTKSKAGSITRKEGQQTAGTVDEKNRVKLQEDEPRMSRKRDGEKRGGCRAR